VSIGNRRERRVELGGGAPMAGRGEHKETATGVHTRGVVQRFYRGARGGDLCCDMKEGGEGGPDRRWGAYVTGGRRGRGTARRVVRAARGERTSPKGLGSGCVRPGEEDLDTRGRRGGPGR
jgi:hypothetical protein